MSQKMMYCKTVLEGTHYEIGKRMIQATKKRSPELIEWLMMQPEGTKELTDEEALERCDRFNQYSHGLGDEIRGLADGLGIPLRKLGNVLLNGIRPAIPCGCSVVGVSPAKTSDGHAYIAQSYEFSYEDEYEFAVVRAEGSYAHMGFVFYQVGRFDGINEKGLCAAITCLENVVSAQSSEEGMSFSFLVRILLDSCATTREAVQKLSELPIYTNANLMIADRSGDVVDMEILTNHDGVHMIERKAEPYVYGFNHYLSKENSAIAPQKRYFSYDRELFVEHFMQEHPQVSEDDLKQVLREELPNGLSCPAYSYYFGTLRSNLFDATESAMYVCFGHPAHTPYRKMDLWEEENEELIEVVYEEKKVSDQFWQMVE